MILMKLQYSLVTIGAALAAAASSLTIYMRLKRVLKPECRKKAVWQVWSDFFSKPYLRRIHLRHKFPGQSKRETGLDWGTVRRNSPRVL